MNSKKIERHVDDFLSPIDPGGSFLRVAQRLAIASHDEATVRQALGKIWQWANGPALSARESYLYEQVRRPGTPYGKIAGKARLALLGGVGYLRTQEALTKPGALTIIAGQLATPDKFLATIEQNLALVDSEFVGRLLVESEVRAGRDPTFDGSIREGADCLRSWGPKLPKLAVFKATKVYDPDTQAAQILMPDDLPDPGSGPSGEPGGGAEGDAEPIGCTVSPDDMDKEDWTCVAVMVIVVVIVVVIGCS